MSELERMPREAPTTSGKDTFQLLVAGTCFLVTGMAAVLLIWLVFGGIAEHGPHTDGGWLMLVLAMMCLPLGALLLLLGGAKWVGKRRG